MTWRRICCYCDRPIHSDGVKVGRSKYGKKKIYWAHKECLCNMKDFVEKLRNDKQN